MVNVFVTGLYRSGTTLLEKIISNHSQAQIASQPFPYLYFRCKNDFLASIHTSRRYPLDDLFLEDAYTERDLFKFLKAKQYDPEAINQIYREMRDYFGQWTPELTSLHLNLRGGFLVDIYHGLLKEFGKLFQEELKVLGSKEIICEEFIPYFLRKGVKVLHIIRDPRDVILSLNTKKGQHYTGTPRPTLFTIRAWRKSVAYYCLCRNNPSYRMIRFSDLVMNFQKSTQQLFSFLELDDEAINDQEIRDQFGRRWSGNSSFDVKKGIDRQAVGGYNRRLDSNLLGYIEKLCYPELRLLRFPLVKDTDQILKYDLTDFIEPQIIDREEFTPDFSLEPTNLSNEETRLHLLRSQKRLDRASILKWFLNEEAYTTLKLQMDERDKV